MSHGLLKDFAYLFASSHDRFVTRLEEALHLLGQEHEFLFIELDVVLRLYQSPINAFEYSLLDCLLVTVDSLDEEVHVGLNEEDLPLLLLTQSI